MKKWLWLVVLALAAAVLWWKQPWRARASGEVAGGAAKEKTAKALYQCPMHPHYVSDHPGNCPICGMALVPVDHAAHADSGAHGPGGVRIDPATVQNMGVKTAPVERRALAPEVRTSGKVAVDETRQFSVNARVAGWVEKLNAASTGQAVKRGEPLLELYSPDLLSTQEEYLQAYRYAKSLGAASTGGVAAAAWDLVESSRRRLVNWDVPEGRIRELESRGSAQKTLPVLSPVTGVVLEKAVLQGQNVSPGMPMFRIADLSRVWVVANLYQEDVALVKTGAPAEINLSYLPGKAFRGKVAFIAPVLDAETRTAEVRIEVANTPALDLKPEMFATVTLRAPRADTVVAVPDQAVIRSGRRNVVILALGDGYFEPREVTLGRVSDGYVEVLEGVKEGETLVVSSQFLIDSESNLKAAIKQMQGGAAGDSPGDVGGMGGGR